VYNFYDKQKNKNMSTTPNLNDEEGAIPVPQAMQMTTNWRTYLDATNPDFNVRSYYIPISSFKSVLKNNHKAEAVRAYIGLADPTDPTTSQLLLIPIVDGKEVPYLPPTGDGLGGPGGSNIYDLTQPCPPDCGDGTGGLDGY
jgi:hypothetical protein